MQQYPDPYGATANNPRYPRLRRPLPGRAGRLPVARRRPAAAGACATAAPEPSPGPAPSGHPPDGRPRDGLGPRPRPGRARLLPRTGRGVSRARGRGPRQPPARPSRPPRAARGGKRRSGCACLVGRWSCSAAASAPPATSATILPVATSPPRPTTRATGSGDVQVKIPEGTTLADMGEHPAARPASSSAPGAFVAAADANHKARGIQPGIYSCTSRCRPPPPSR